MVYVLLILFLLSFFVVYFARRMLVGRTSRVSRARITALNLSPTRVSPSPTPASAIMLHRAAHAYVAASKKDSVDTENDSLSPDNSNDSSAANIKSSNNPPYRPVGSSVNTLLRPIPQTTVNTLGQKQLHTNSSVKRTASGLAKALGSQGDGFQPSENAQSKTAITKPQTGSVVLFEDDFDSDIELEVEQPIPRSTVSYPKLPATYPNAPRTAQLHTQASVNHDYHGPASSPSQAASPSTQPIPWSSSPDYHKEPPVQSARLVYANQQLSAEQNADTFAAEPHSRPSKRRTLPWAKDGDNEAELGESAAPETFRTPSSKSSTFPWMSTASAIKEQQKQLRKATKKGAKDSDAPEKSEAGPLKVSMKKNRAVVGPMLSKEQRHVLDLVVEQGKSVFFTGSAGTGKSVLLREIIAVLRKKHQKEIDRVAVTASTGLAACNVGGVTLHSFAGIGLGKESVEELVKKIKRNQKAKHRWMRTKVLIVDEVSMVDGELFDKLEAIGRRMRNNARPFGGIQLVITGDFFQLPPVPDSNRMATFAFDAKQWDAAIHHTIGLHHVFRQKDAVFANMLNEMREGRLSQQSAETFRNLSRPLAVRAGDDREATELFPTRAEVDAANSNKMRQLSGGLMVYEARDGGAIQDKEQRDKLLANCMAPQELVLKKGAQVMLIKNIDENLVNGSLGKVHSFMTEEMFTAYDGNPALFSTPRDEDESPSQEWSAQRHKDKLKLDALKASTSQLWPMVRFMIADGTTRDLLCTRESWKVELPNGEVQAFRNQVPLILAWALSIHKAQGQTLEKVKVDLGKVFEKGQAYVALSRATSIEGLQVLRFDPSKVMAHDRVRNFYSGLSRAEINQGPESR